jgi:hypothetical protein
MSAPEILTATPKFARAKNSKNPYEKGTPEYAEEFKRRARERWQERKAVYRKPVAVETEPDRTKDDAPPVPKSETEWDVPEDLRDSLNGKAKLVLPANTRDWPMFHVKRPSELSTTTQKIYKAYNGSMPKASVIWDVVRAINTYPLAQRNQYAKAGLSKVSNDLYGDIYEANRKGLAKSPAYSADLLRMLVFSELTKSTKKESFKQHTAQVASDARLDNTVRWPDWVEQARRYTKAVLTNKVASQREKSDAVLATVYSQLPPVRLDWNDVEVRKVKGGKAMADYKGEKGKNILYLAYNEAVMTWNEFKNSSSFPNGIRQPMPKEVVSVMKKAWGKEPPAHPFKHPNFSTYLTKLAEIITGKAFSNRLMRSSFIRYFHEKNSRDGVDLEKTKAIMRDLHQSNVEIHLGYNKTKTVTPEMAE